MGPIFINLNTVNGKTLISVFLFYFREQLGIAVTVWTCILKVLGSILGEDTSYSY
jgi:hypothetical protein